MEKVAFLSGLVLVMIFILGAVSSYLDKRSKKNRTNEMKDGAVYSVIKLHQQGHEVIAGVNNPSNSSGMGSRKYVAPVQQAAAARAIGE